MAERMAVGMSVYGFQAELGTQLQAKLAFCLVIQEGSNVPPRDLDAASLRICLPGYCN